MFVEKLISFMKKKIKVPYNYLPFEFKNPNKIIKNWKKLIETNKYLERGIPTKYLIKIKKN